SILLRIVGIEVRPVLRDPPEVAIKSDDNQQEHADRPLDHPASSGVPAPRRDERPAYPGDDETDPLANRLKNSGEEVNDRVQHGSPSVLEAKKASAIARLILQIRVFKHLDNVAPPHRIEVLVIAVKSLLVKDVPRHEVEWDEVRDQSVCQPCIRMIWLCANQKESLLRGHFIDLDLPILCQLTLHCVQKWESPLPVDLIRMRMDPGLQPDPV